MNLNSIALMSNFIFDSLFKKPKILQNKKNCKIHTNQTVINVNQQWFALSHILKLKSTNHKKKKKSISINHGFFKEKY